MNPYAYIREQVIAMVGALADDGVLPAGMDFANLAVEAPRDPSHGDVATNAALVLTKQARMKPRDIATPLAERLAEQWPGTYDAWNGEQVTSAVKPHGISTRQVKRQGQNKRGLAVIDLRQAVAERQPPPLELGIELDDLLAPTTNSGDDIDPAA